ncbi:MAG TPA: sugar transferase [Acidobacteriota bacterium]|nr:sugar transferase [Acidobacteriota bacterium]
MRRFFDIVCSSAGLLVLSPLFLMAAFLVKATSKGPVFFLQERIGRNGKVFNLMKFRTMKPVSLGPKITRSGDSRITTFGRLLRKTKIDELPQLINVLKGDMSLVGPRPEVREYVAMDDPLWRKVLSVRPGLTDPVTLRLRNEEEVLAQAADTEKFYREKLLGYKLRGYAEYVDTACFRGDLKIIFLTAASVLFPSLSPPLSAEEIEKGWNRGE